MKTVFKYALAMEDRVEIAMPERSELLFVAAQHNQLWLWVRVVPSNELVTRTFYVRGTGHPDALGAYVGSALLHDGALVLHVFEINPPEQG